MDYCLFHGVSNKEVILDVVSTVRLYLDLVGISVIQREADDILLLKFQGRVVNPRFLPFQGLHVDWKTYIGGKCIPD